MKLSNGSEMLLNKDMPMLNSSSVDAIVREKGLNQIKKRQKSGMENLLSRAMQKHNIGLEISAMARRP